LPLFQLWLGLLFHLVAAHGLWYGPFYGWMLLVSAWARRAAFLWALVPLFAIGIVEKVAFNTSHFVIMVGNRFAGGMDDNGSKATGMMGMLVGHSPGHFLISPGLWLGLAFTAACLFAAVRLRRYRGPI